MTTFNLADIFVALGRRHHNRPALVSGSRSLTFGELAALAARAAHELHKEGVAPGENVGLALRDGLDVAVYLVAIWMIDAVAVILDFRSPLAERDALAEEFDLVTILTDSASQGAKHPSINIGGEWTERVARQISTPPVSARDASEFSVIALTSGTTARPLGMMVRHEDTLRLLTHPLQRHMGSMGTYFLSQPLHFSAARTNLVARLAMGWTVVIYPPLHDIAELAETIIRVSPDMAMLVPTTARGLLDYAATRTSVPLFPSFRQLMLGGAATPPEEKRAARRLLSENYVEVYGSTLCAGMSYLQGDDFDTHADTVGRVSETVRLEIVDDNDNALPSTQEGIIRVRAPYMVTRTYKDRTRASGDKIKDGWVYPGDLGSVDGDGYLRLLGRGSDLIIRGGANVHPAEIEAVLSEHPRVREVAVVGFQSAREGEEIAAFIVSDGTLTEADLQALVRSRLSPDKRPRRFVFSDALPLTSVGKLDRKALKSSLEQATADSGDNSPD